MTADQSTDRRLTFQEVDGGTALWWNAEGEWTVLPVLDDQQKAQLVALIQRVLYAGRRDAKREIREVLGVSK